MDSQLIRNLVLALCLCAAAFGQVGILAPIASGTTSGAAPTAPGFVQAQNCTTGSTNCNVSITATGGNSLFVAAFQYATITSWTIGDTHNTYNIVNSLLSLASCCSVETFLATNITGGALTITCNPNTGVTTTACIVFELTPGTAISVDQLATGTDNSSPTSWTTSATSATTQANELLVSCGGKSGANVTSFTAGSGYTIPTNGSVVASGVMCEYESVSSTGAQTGTATVGTGTSYVMTIATLK